MVCLRVFLPLRSVLHGPARPSFSDSRPSSAEKAQLCKTWPGVWALGLAMLCFLLLVHLLPPAKQQGLKDWMSTSVRHSHLELVDPRKGLSLSSRPLSKITRILLCGAHFISTQAAQNPHLVSLYRTSTVWDTVPHLTISWSGIRLVGTAICPYLLKSLKEPVLKPAPSAQPAPSCVL